MQHLIEIAGTSDQILQAMVICHGEWIEWVLNRYADAKDD